MFENLGTILYINKSLLFEIFIQLINTSILILAITKNVYVPVKMFMKKRSEGIRSEIASAEEKLEEANILKETYEKKLEAIEDEKIKILESAHKRGIAREDQIIREAREEAEVIKSRVMIEIEREKVKVKESMKSQIIDISSLIASRVIDDSVEVDKQSKLIDSAIEEIGDIKWLG